MIDRTPGPTRRTLIVGSAALGLEVSAFADVNDAAAAADGGPSALRPFRFHAPEAALVDLQRRILATRWPEKETVADHSQGVPLATMRDLARHWATDYDWRRVEARLNALPQLVTRIDGLDIHFIHVRSRHEDALPVVVTHGWPGSIIEQLKIVEPLTDPTAHGAGAADAFHVVIPSIPGYGFSDRPAAAGWNAAHVARAWSVLMKRLGYTRYVAQGGDVGAIITHEMARQAAPELLAIHVNFPGAVPLDVARSLAAGGAAPAGLSPDEQRAYDQVKDFRASHFAYAAMMTTRPQTLYQIADSPVALAAWILDHGDGYDQPAAAMVSAVAGRTIDGHAAGDVTRDDVLDDITLYWLTNTAVSAARFYWENRGMNAIGAADVAVRAAVSVYPGEIYRPPRSWAERAYANLIYFNELDRGGHFAAWEQSELFSQELRAAFRSLRGAA